MPTIVNYSPSFIDRLTSAEQMGVRPSADGTIELTPTLLAPLTTYTYEYVLRFSFPWEDLVAGFDQSPYNQPSLEEAPPVHNHPAPPAPPSQSVSSKEAVVASSSGTPSPKPAQPIHWGPQARRYEAVPPPSGVQGKINEWKAQRLVAVAASMIGYLYNHHHIPDYYGPTSTPQFKDKGLDCSNYTSWLYNYALGIRVNSDTGKQSRLAGATLADQHGYEYHVTRVADALMDYQTLCSTLQTGDLLFIAGGPKDSKDVIQQAIQNHQPIEITHVIMWLGDVGVSKSGTPLVTDSHGNELKDDNQQAIPNGIQVRPFYQTNNGDTTDTGEYAPNWYFEHFAWALRILPKL
jgi:cell wall-associated NlpC family hydrolase